MNIHSTSFRFFGILILMFLVSFSELKANDNDEEGLLYDNESHPLETLSPLVIATGSGDSLYYHTVTVKEDTVPKKLADINILNK